MELYTTNLQAMAERHRVFAHNQRIDARCWLRTNLIPHLRANGGALPWETVVAWSGMDGTRLAQLVDLMPRTIHRLEDMSCNRLLALFDASVTCIWWRVHRYTKRSDNWQLRKAGR